MRKIVLDLYITLVMPLSVIAILSLLSAIRDWRESQKVMARFFLCMMLVLAAALSAFLSVDDQTRVSIGVSFYEIMLGLCPFLFLLSALALYYLSREGIDPQKAIRMAGLILVMLAAAGGAVHFHAPSA